MSGRDRDEDGARPTRRRFLATTGGLIAVAGSALATGAAAEIPAATKIATSVGYARSQSVIEPFWGAHQGGIVTPQQSHSYFAVFDFTATKRDDLVKLLREWTAAAAKMTRGEAIEPFQQEAADYNSDAGAAPAPASVVAPDSGEARGLTPARLTLTFGFGPGLFVKDGQDRYGIAALRPEAFVDMPKFVGDQLVEARTGGDLSVQACADDPQVAFHAVRQLARLGDGVAQLRWTQAGFMPDFGAKKTPRNLMGFKDGTNNPAIADAQAMGKVVWVGSEGPDWMRGGSYLAARRIRIALEHWDRMNVGFQEQTVGRRKYSGAPLGGKSESEPLNLAATDKDGNPVIPENSHVRLAAAASNGVRRSCGGATLSMTASPSPPSAGRPGGKAWSTMLACSFWLISAIRAPGSSRSSTPCRSST